MRPLKQKVSVTLDEDIVKRVKELSEEQQRSFSQYINLVLTEHLKHLEQTGKVEDRIFYKAFNLIEGLIFRRKFCRRSRNFHAISLRPYDGYAIIYN